MLLLLAFTANTAVAQEYDWGTFSRYDTLRGTLNAYRAPWDVYFYDLDVEVMPESRSIRGRNTMYFKVEDEFDTLQVDLFENMVMDSIVFRGNALPFWRDSHHVFVQMPRRLMEPELHELEMYYHGKPIVAENAPWDGGFVWDRTETGEPWVTVAVEGIGASLWWPNKDHLSDEPDSMSISITVPEGLVAVSNGQLREVEQLDGRSRYDWFVSYPINNYNVTLNIADYAHFSDTFQSEAGRLPLDFYVLQSHEEAAKKHFQQVKPMLRCFEQYFGPYPFFRDGYALVETPYWGMEHQGAIAYGNQFRNNPFGFDFIIIHESGHEWFGNALSVGDHGEMWLHEALTTYSEFLYLECLHDFETAVRYLKTQRQRIGYQEPILGPLGVNYHEWPDADMYYKGTWMLHTIRTILNDDSLFLGIIRDFALLYRYQIIDTELFIDYLEDRTGRNWRPFFRQYLTEVAIPTLHYELKQRGRNTILRYRLRSHVEGLEMPIHLQAGGEEHTLQAGSDWQKVKLKGVAPDEVEWPKDLYLVNFRALE